MYILIKSRVFNLSHTYTHSYPICWQTKGIEVAGGSAPISALDLCSPNLTLAIGNEFGVVRNSINFLFVTSFSRDEDTTKNFISL